MISKQFFKKLHFLAVLVLPYLIYAQCITGTSPALSTLSGQTATTAFGTGTVSLNGSVMGFAFLANAGQSNANRIGNDHNASEYGIYISHPNNSATTHATSIQCAITFTAPVGGLKFIINDIDNNDYVRVRVFDENGISIPLVQNSNFTFMGGSSTVVEYNSSVQEFYDDDNQASDDNSRDGSVSFNFSGKKVSKIEFDYYDTNNTGAITFTRFETPCIAANNDSYLATKGIALTTTSVLSNDLYNGAQATTSNVSVTPMTTVPAGFTFSTAGVITVSNTVPAGVYRIPYQLCQSGQANNCTVALATVVVFEDSDGDTVPDYLDLDDDNDGILDTDECEPTNIVTNGTFAGTITGWSPGPGWLYNSANGQTAINESDVAANSSLSQSITNLSNVESGIVSLNLRVGAQDNANSAGRISTLEILLNGTVYATLRNGILRNNSNITLDLAPGVSSTFTTFGTGPATGFNYSAPFTINIPYTGPTTADLTFRLVAGPDDWSIDDVSVNASICDADGDGIRNSLDLDSDGDGCFDAIEGDENVTTAQLTNGRISGTVNANGVPNLVNSGGVADIGGDVGQGFGYSQNSSLNACKDADADGVIDNLDLDSDNDGVLDTDEGSFCGKIGRNIRVGYLTVGGAGDGLATNLLLNLNNYGTYGTYKNVTGVTLVPFTTVISVTEAALVSNNIDVFFVGSTADNNNNATGTSTTNKAPTSVNNILTTWAKNTGKVIFAIQNNAVDFGYLTTANNANPNVPSGTVGNQVYTNGYWPTPSLTQTGSVQMTLSSTTRLFNTLMVDNTGKPVVVSDQEYNLVIFPDATIYIAEANQAIIGNDNDRKAIADNWAYVFDRFVSKQCTSINTDGDSLPNHLDLDSDGDGCSDAFESGATTSLAANYVFPSVAGTSTDTNSDGLADTVDGSPLDGIPNYVSTYEIATNASNKKCLDSDGDTILDTVDLDDDNDGILDTDEGFACTSLNRNLRIGYLNTTLGRTGLMINMLSNLANFSYTGTFKKFPGITFVPYANEAAITEAQLLTDNVDLFYAGSSASDAQTATDKLSAALNARILTWVNNNNKGAIILQNNATDYGYQVTNNNTNNNSPHGVVGQKVFTNGYWPESTFAQSGGVQMTIASLTNAYETAMVDAQGKSTFIKDKNRKIVFFPDTTIFADNVSVADVNNATLRVAADVWAYAFDIFLMDVCTSTDTDGDGIPDYLDLDSDGDGCSDAREGAGNFNPTTTASGPIASQTPNTNFGTAVNTTTGIPTAVGAGQGVGQAQNAAQNDCLDTDGDGVPDWQDLDDDNDGILDTDECVPPSDLVIWGNSGNYAATITASGTNLLTGQNSTAGSGLVRNLAGSQQSINQVDAVTEAGAIANNEYVEYKITVGTKQLFLSQLKYYSSPSPNAAYTMSVRMSSDNFATNTLVQAGYNYTSTGNNFTVNTTQIFYLNPNTTYTFRVYFYNVTGGAASNIAHDDFTLRGNSECDTDGDGIPNRLDLDSDGDGCPDAIEGDENVLASHLNPNGSINTTLTPNNGVGSATNNLGVPNWVNAGAADVGGDVGQGIGDSQNAAISTCYIDAVNDINQTPAGTAVSGTVLTNDKANGAITMQSGTYLNASGVATAFVFGTAASVYTSTGTLAGTMTLNSNGTYTFTPTAGFTGIVPISYTIANPVGSTDTASLEIRVIPAINLALNNPPTAMNDTAVTESGTTVTSTVLSNDSDPDGNALTVTGATQGATVITIGTGVAVSGVNAAGVTVANAGTLTVNTNGSYTFIPAPGFVGDVNPVNYTISDGNGGTSTAKIDIKVVPNNGNAVFTNDDAIAVPKGTVNAAGNVLNNDFDPEGNSISVTGATINGTAITPGVPTLIAGVGTITLNSNGAYTFSPLLTYVGTTNVIYTVCDNVATTPACSQATLHLTSLDAGLAVCYEDPALVAGATYPVKHGVTILGRAGATNGNWPMLRNSAYTALESKTKGFVVTRNSSPETTITIPVVGMMVFDTDENAGAGCLKIYTGPAVGEGWKCFSTQGCP